MKIYTKILITTLPLVLISLIAGAGTTYYLSKKALSNLAENWLETRSSEAIQIVANNEEFLQGYGFKNIASGVKKAQYDAANMLRSIKIGELGYVFAVDSKGRVVAHSDSRLIGTDISKKAWFSEMALKSRGRLIYSWHGEKYLSIFEYFKPWKWYIIVTDPLTEVYGAVNKTRIYILGIGFFGSIFMALVLILLTRKLIVPLHLLVSGAQEIGRGKLETRIPVQTRDEIGHLSEVFNTMACQLQEGHGDLKQSESYYRSLIENTPGIIMILNKEGLFHYLSPSFERVLGYGSKGYIGKNVFGLVHPEDLSNFKGFFDATLILEEGIQNEEFRFLHKNGSWHIFEITSQNLLKNPAVNCVIFNSLDVTMRKQVEEALRESEKRLQFLTSQLLTAQEGERKRLSVELHDEVGQSLTVMKLKITMLEKALDLKQKELKKECEETLAYIDQVIKNVRRLCRDLTPSAIDDIGLTAALHWLAENFTKHYTLEAEVDISEIDDFFSHEMQIVIYRIFQESFANIGKHAEASKIRILVEKRNDKVSFLIEDDGEGFDLKKVMQKGFKDRGLGLAAMYERARMLGASFNIKSTKGFGTCIRFNISAEKGKT